MRVGLLFICAIVGITLTSTRTIDKAFEGKIVYKINYEKVPAEMEGYESMLPQEMTMFFKDSKVRIEQSMGMGGTQIVMSDNSAKTADILMDMMGQKIHIHMTKEEIEEAEKDTQKPEITYLEGEKEIVGYKCKKAEIKNGETLTTVYYSDKLQITHNDYKELNGFPLEYTASTEGMEMVITASEVQKEKLPDTLFEIPEGYDLMTMEELGNMMGN